MEAFFLDDQVPQELYRYRIIKLTMPLVEKRHLLTEPTGEAGTITVSGREDGAIRCCMSPMTAQASPADTRAGLLPPNVRAAMRPETASACTRTPPSADAVRRRLRLTIERAGLRHLRDRAHPEGGMRCIRFCWWTMNR